MLTEFTFGTILPIANTCPVQWERTAQTNMSCYTIPDHQVWGQPKVQLFIIAGLVEPCSLFDKWQHKNQKEKYNRV